MEEACVGKRVENRGEFDRALATLKLPVMAIRIKDGSRVLISEKKDEVLAQQLFSNGSTAVFIRVER